VVMVLVHSGVFILDFHFWSPGRSIVQPIRSFAGLSVSRPTLLCSGCRGVWPSWTTLTELL
jgi:hypothetical protein